ncbi:MAG: thiamine biosynthesis protein ThiS [Verrucomicrobiaceae bacterium]|jgi:thiamine biosynthesis protein ThiS|nr:thiamine biosynthesis protein ThiS [Verrucomicrobiaceae bacterium]
MHIILNGDTHEVEREWSIAELLVSLDLTNKPVVVELDGRALTRKELSSNAMAEGSRVEIVVLSAGG